MSATYEGLAFAMMGTTDGDLIDGSSEIPIGEAFRLAAEYLGLRPDTNVDGTPQYVRSRCTTCDEVIEGDRYEATIFHEAHIDWQPHECPPSDEERPSRDAFGEPRNRAAFKAQAEADRIAGGTIHER